MTTGSMYHTNTQASNVTVFFNEKRNVEIIMPVPIDKGVAPYYNRRKQTLNVKLWRLLSSIYTVFILENTIKEYTFMQPRPEANSETASSYARNLHRVYAGGLILVSFIILQDFLNLRTLDTAALISVLAFSIALPLLSATFVLDVVERRYPYGPHNAAVTWAVHAAFVLGIFAALTGVGAAFWHPGKLTGITFLCSLLVTFVIYGTYILSLGENVRHH